MAQEKNIWKFNDDEWKVHISDKKVCDKLSMKFNLKASTVYYETGVLSEEPSCEIMGPYNLISDVKTMLKEPT